MSSAKKRAEQHLIDQDGMSLLREKLPRHWVLREYRPDYGLDFAIETFTSVAAIEGEPGIYETLGEHVFVQLKSVAAPKAAPLKIEGRSNVEKGPEILRRDDPVPKINTYRFLLETSELVTIERMGIAVPVLLVIADLSMRRCSFVCLNDYIDKILVPRHTDYAAKNSRTIHVPVCNEVVSDPKGIGTLRWYAKRPKLLAAFQRFNYQYAELQNSSEKSDWNKLRETIFANQKRLGIMPENAKLTAWPDGQAEYGGAKLPQWDSLSLEQKKLFIRQADVYGAYEAYTDHEIGRVIQAVEDLGQLDNTLIGNVTPADVYFGRAKRHCHGQPLPSSSSGA